MRRQREWVAIALIALMMFGIVPLSSGMVYGGNNKSDSIKVSKNISAKNANPEADFKFNPSNGEITEYIGNSKDVIVPDTIGGVEVKIIGETAFNFW